MNLHDHFSFFSDADETLYAKPLPGKPPYTGIHTIYIMGKVWTGLCEFII